MRNKLDMQLAQLNEELIAMGALCEEAIALSAKALIEEDAGIAKGVSNLEEQIDQKEKDIESLCLKLLLQQQPVARDLRQISAALKMITDMERIGDQAKDISELIPYLKDCTKAQYACIGEMARAVIKMVTDSVDAYVKKDVDSALAVIAQDDTVDRYFVEMKKALIKLIGERPDEGEVAIDLLMVAKYLERIGDHAENIAEWVVFSVTGKRPEGEEE